MKTVLLALAAFLWEWFKQVFIALDQAVNAIFGPLFTFSIGWADETLSARCGRNYLKRRWMAMIFLPIIDFLFIWQPPDPNVVDESGKPIKSHCIRAYYKERLRRDLAPEYRT